ncbi:MAG TPA: VOC family protein [Acidimicrobiales bacterium]|nr:VOC family protein [Acidimicrobiales bacterium]
MLRILHLSLPVRDLAEARHFYVHSMGCQAARERDGFCDVWFFGMQLTLQDRADEVAPLEPGSARHFGVTLGRAEFDALVTRLVAHGVAWVAPPTTDAQGRRTEQTKAKLADPSGNVIELKTYRDPVAALEIPPHSSPEAVEHGS